VLWRMYVVQSVVGGSARPGWRLHAGWYGREWPPAQQLKESTQEPLTSAWGQLRLFHCAVFRPPHLMHSLSLAPVPPRGSPHAPSPPPSSGAEHCQRGLLLHLLRTASCTPDVARALSWPRRILMALDAAKVGGQLGH